MSDQAKRVEILQGSGTGYWKRGQYGYVIHTNYDGGMHFVNVSRVSRRGEPAYLVSKTRGARGGALWFSASGIRFTGHK